MILYGTKYKFLNSKNPSYLSCSHCKTEGNISMKVLTKYAYLYFIPMFPMKKVGIAECGHCKKVYKEKEMSEQMKKELQNQKDKTKSPIWQYSGSVLLVLVISGAVFFKNLENEEKEKFIQSPQKGDVYEYKEANGYSTMKVVSVNSDSVFIKYNTYGIDKISKIDQIELPENYEKEVYRISKKQLQEMYEKREIIGVNRN